MRTGFRFVLSACREKGAAAGAFNIWDGVSALAVLEAAQERDLPVILQTSVSTVRQYGARRLGEMLCSLRDGAGIPAALHLDHCRDPDLACECLQAGWDSVMFDGSALPLKENIALTRSVAQQAHRMGAAAEGELGVIPGQEEEVVAFCAGKTSLKAAQRFLQETQIDAFAPALGTAHGVYREKPKLDFESARRLSGLGVPLVVHGGSGLDPASFRQFVRCGAAKINISTALKLSCMQAVRTYLEAGGEADPLRMGRQIQQAVRTTAGQHLDWFSGGEGPA